MMEQITEKQEDHAVALLKDLRAAIDKYDAAMIEAGADQEARREYLAAQILGVLGEYLPAMLDGDYVDLDQRGVLQ